MQTVTFGPEHVHAAQLGRRILPTPAEPSSDLEWLEREGNRLAALGHDAGKAAAEALRSIVRDMDSRSVRSIADLESRRDEDLEEDYQRYLERERDYDNAFHDFHVLEPV
jgi:2-methylisocitrate lyase-like PEP mutase family enzyme